MPTLATILLSDSASDDANGFDTNWSDYDIVTQAVLLFPDLTAAISDPNASLTVFLPNDAAFRLLVENLTNVWPKTEKQTFELVASLGTDTVKNVLLYHLLGAKVGVDTVLRSNGVRVPTLLSGTNFKINIRGSVVKLIDNDPNAKNPAVIAPNLGGEASNGFAHGISKVLRPVDLPDQ
ncbi:MAG: Fasciclin, partial [Ilumatobacteraceae bacterium]|nr:Fasciclin [Ilumatobacteraceae bacterium]